MPINKGLSISWYGPVDNAKRNKRDLCVLRRGKLSWYQVED